MGVAPSNATGMGDARVVLRAGPHRVTREDIIEKVLKERHVKPGTVVVNLQNAKYFKKAKDGKWSVVKG